MRKSLIIMLLPAVMVSCDKLSQSNQSEIALAPEINVMNTRGYVQGSTMEDSDGEAVRVIYLSAYDVTDSRNYFSGGTFKQDDAVWRCFDESTPAPKYWPIDHSMKFLAYSAASSAPAAVWNPTDASAGLDLYVGKESLQDDILIAAAKERKNTGESVALKFSHIQAWIEYEIRADMPSDVTIENVTFNNVYSSGYFSAENFSATLVSKWNFNSSTASEYKVNPSGSSTITSDSDKVNVTVLMPAQAAQEAVINYSSGGVHKTATIGKKVSDWEMGVHYVYKIIITPLLTRGGESVSAQDNVEVELLEKVW